MKLPHDSIKERRLGAGGIPQRYIIVFLTFLCTSICYIERVGFSLAYTATAVKVGTDQATKGWVLSAFYYGYASSQVPGGWAAQQIGGRKVLTFSFILWSVCCILTPTEPGPIYGLIVSRLLVGVAQGFIFPSIHTVLAQWIPPHEKSRSVSLTTSGMYFGAAIAMLFLPSLVASRGPEAVFQLVAALGFLWALVWMRYSVDPPGGATAMGHSVPSPTGREVAVSKETTIEMDGGKMSPSRHRRAAAKDEIPWGRIMVSLPVWAIVVNNFTFHYALYVLMNWLPTYFDQALHASLHSLGASKMLPYFGMFVICNVGGVLADYLITRRIFSVTITRKILNTAGFATSAVALVLTPVLNSVSGAIFCASLTLGACALARAGFAVNHMDIAPRYAGIVMGVSNTAGTVAGVVGVAATGLILEAFGGEGSEAEGWRLVFTSPALLCILSAILFCVFATGERIFE